MDTAETVAKHVLEAILSGTMAYQHEQSNGEYDFELRYNNGAVAAVEVTSSVDEIQTGIMAAIRSTKKGGPFIQAIECRESWIIVPTKIANINNIRAKIDGHLSKVEQAGITKFFCIRDRSECVQDLRSELNVMSGSILSLEAPPKIRIAFPAGGGATGSSIATEAGEKEAWKKDNREKLGAAKTAERHLVVYIDVMNGLPWVALTDCDPPSSLPNLPQEITCIWLVSHGKEVDEFVVWRGDTKQPWRSMKIIRPMSDGDAHGDKVGGYREITSSVLPKA